MGPILIASGIAALLYGCYTFWLRRNYPERFLKLARMKHVWGDGIGTAIHVIGYSAVPIAFGLAMICLGSLGGPAEAAPQPTDNLQLSPEQRSALRFGTAQGELMAAGFTMVGGAKKDRIDVADGDFRAAIVLSGRGYRVERSGHAPIDQVPIDDAVARILEAHQPKR